MSRQARKDETRRIELTLDELEGVSGVARVLYLWPS
jgi:hypothetical protein